MRLHVNNPLIYLAFFVFHFLKSLMLSTLRLCRFFGFLVYYCITVNSCFCCFFNFLPSLLLTLFFLFFLPFSILKLLSYLLKTRIESKKKFERFWRNNLFDIFFFKKRKCVESFEFSSFPLENMNLI
jgi:hypothetical protein